MAKLIDARGRPCPQPVLMTKKAVDAGERELEVLVDNEGAVQNVTRFAEKQGFSVRVEREGFDFKLILSGGSAGEAQATSEPADAEITCETGTWKLNRGQVLLVKSDSVGRGSDELGNILMKSLINTLAENTELPEKVVLINAGVKLVCEGSEIIDAFKAIENKGVEIFACGTCLNYYNLQDKIQAGKISNAFEILNILLQSNRIVELS